MDKYTLLDKIEKLVQRVNALNFRFVDPNSQREAAQLLESAAASLEEYADLVEADEGDDQSNDDDT